MIILALCLVGIAIPSWHWKLIRDEKRDVRLLYLRERIRDFSVKYQNEDCIVVSKSDHLLYYCRRGEVVKNDVWNGFVYNFPVKVALAGKYYRTPEGEMFIDDKNQNSRYILFLKFSHPGAYGLHSAETRYRGFLEKMERIYPNFIFATKKDDTRGCVQVENRVIKYLFSKVDLNTPVLIIP